MTADFTTGGSARPGRILGLLTILLDLSSQPFKGSREEANVGICKKLG